MYRVYVYWAVEFLNYLALVFWGLNLFIKKYKIQVHRKIWIQNLIVIVCAIPIAGFSADNYKIVVYSNTVSHTLILYTYILLKLFTKGKIKKAFSLVAIYMNCMRMIDLWIVAVITEVNRVSRYVELDLIHMGIGRSVFMIFLSMCYYLVYRILNNSKFLDSLYGNALYRWSVCLYSLLGVMCFCTVYRFDYNQQLIRYWNFYLICAFVSSGIFFLYLIQTKIQERERILNTRNDMMEANYQGLQKAYEQNQLLYHDYKNHMLAIRQLVKEYRNEEALEYINTYVELTLKMKQKINSGSKILDIIVNSKLGEAREKNIKFSYEIGYIGNIDMEDIDMCALMANLLDNAIEACERIDNEKVWIRLKVVRKNDMLLIGLSNSINEEEARKKNFFQSKKNHSEKHGWGMKSMEKVLRKYDGNKEYYVRNREFEIFIYIPISSKEIFKDKKL